MKLMKKVSSFLWKLHMKRLPLPKAILNGLMFKKEEGIKGNENMG